MCLGSIAPEDTANTPKYLLIILTDRRPSEPSPRNVVQRYQFRKK